MKKVLWIAQREFLATVMTKGFIIGILITPTMITLLIILMPMLINENAPSIEGEIAVIDPTGTISDGLGRYLQPEQIARRRSDLKEQVEEQLAELPVPGGDQQARDKAMDAALGEVPKLTVVSRPLGTDLEAEKQQLLEPMGEGAGRLAVVVVHPNAVSPSETGEYGSYDLYIREKLDDRIVNEVCDGLREAIVDARIGTTDLDRDYVEALTRVQRPHSKTVTAEGEKDTNEVLNMLLPAGFMVLLLVSVLASGQQMMTSTVEEKASRVVEVLLSAVSPMQLMSGKIIGQLCVGLVILLLYSSMGVVGLVSFAMLGLLDPWLLVYLVIFFLIAYFVIASLMAAIGSAVNEMREAQTLMTPVMLTIFIPWMLWLPITRNPESTFAVVTSFIPPINTFVMLLRMTSTVPPPLWQVWLSIGVGVASVYVALWFAAKVFRIGLLMYGKPPSFATLVKWARMA